MSSLPSSLRKPLTMKAFSRATWGPVEVTSSLDRVQATARGSGLVTIDVEAARNGQRSAHETLPHGLVVQVDGRPAFRLVQPRRGLSRRRERVVEVHSEGLPVPDGAYFRARWFRGVGLETSSGRPLIRARCDLLEAPAFGLYRTPAVDASVTPELIALWGAVRLHLIGVLHA